MGTGLAFAHCRKSETPGRSSWHHHKVMTIWIQEASQCGVAVGQYYACRCYIVVSERILAWWRARSVTEKFEMRCRALDRKRHYLNRDIGQAVEVLLRQSAIHRSRRRLKSQTLIKLCTHVDIGNTDRGVIDAQTKMRARCMPRNRHVVWGKREKLKRMPLWIAKFERRSAPGRLRQLLRTPIGYRCPVRRRAKPRISLRHIAHDNREVLKDQVGRRCVLRVWVSSLIELQKLNDLLAKVQRDPERATPHTHQGLERRARNLLCRDPAAAQGILVERRQFARTASCEAKPRQTLNGWPGAHGHRVPRRLRKIA